MTQQSVELGEAAGPAVASRGSQWRFHLCMLWMTVLTLGLVADLSLHFIHRPRPTSGARDGSRNLDEDKPVVDPFLDLVPSKTGGFTTDRIPWKDKKNNLVKNEYIRIKEDGFYFLYGQVTLQSASKTSTTVKIIKEVGKDNKELVVEGSIGVGSLSTGFIGKILRLEADSNISMSCSINQNMIKTYKNDNFVTFMGIYRLNKF